MKKELTIYFEEDLAKSPDSWIKVSIPAGQVGSRTGKAMKSSKDLLPVLEK